MATNEEISKQYWSAIQSALNAKGFSVGAVDGIRGEKTDAALVAFKRSVGLATRPYIGPITEKKLWAQISGVPNWPMWLKVAYKYRGLKEIPGAKHNPQILQWWDLIGAGWFNDDETPWCGAFVGGVLAEYGLEILPGSLAPRARAWERWGRGLPGPAVGCLVVFWRGSPKSGNGHVAFVMGRKGGNLVCIGGNQADSVTVAQFDQARAVAYRWPKTEPGPTFVGFDLLPNVDSSGMLSTNES